MLVNPGRVAISLALSLLLLAGCGVSNGTSESSNSTSQPNTQRMGIYNTKGLRSSPSVAWKFRRGEVDLAPRI